MQVKTGTKCSDEILPLLVVSIFRELRCLLKFDVFNLAIPLSDLPIMLERITLVQVIQYE